MILKRWLKKMDDTQYQTKMMVICLIILFILGGLGMVYAQVRIPIELRGGVYNRLEEIKYIQNRTWRDLDKLKRDNEINQTMIHSTLDLFSLENHKTKDKKVFKVQ